MKFVFKQIVRVFVLISYVVFPAQLLALTSDFKQIVFYQSTPSSTAKIAGNDVIVEPIFPVMYAQDGRVFINVTLADHKTASIATYPKTDSNGTHFSPVAVTFKGDYYTVSGDCLMTTLANQTQLNCLFADTNNRRWEFTFNNLKLLSTANK